MRWSSGTTAFLLLLLSFGYEIAGGLGDESAAKRQAEDDRQGVIHVAVTGSDSNSGLSEKEALASPAGARDRLRQMRASGKELGELKIIFHAGIYELGETLELNPSDSGTLLEGVSYQAAKGERVIWSGGSVLSDWRSEGDGLWSGELPEWARSTDGPAFRSLWIDEQRATWAAGTEPGQFMRIEGFPDDQKQDDWTKGQRAFVYAPEDAEVWGRVTAGAEVVTFTRWVDTHLRVESIDREARIVRFSSPNVFQLAPGDLYRIEGAEGLLDRPGEWCVKGDRVQLRWPEKPASVTVPRLSALMRLTGQPENSAWVEHIEFRGIEFAHSRWWFDYSSRQAWPSQEVIGFVQAAHGVPGAIQANGARQLRFVDCRIAHTEGYGLELAKGCMRNQLLRCRLEDLGAGGVKIGETVIREGNELAQENVIEDCSIENGGKIHHQAVGIWIGQSPRNRLSHNLISDFDYTGISIGWTWGYGPSAATANVVEYNEVRNLGDRADNREPPLGDMAGIYTLGTQTDGLTGTHIHHNYFHDIAGRTIAWGIYFDEGSTGITAENNVVLRTTHGSFHQHYGKDNIVRNNILLHGRDAQLWRTRREEHQSFLLERNIVVQETGLMLQGNWSDHFESRCNLFWNPNGPVIFPEGASLTQWATGRDEGSHVADPGVLVDPDRPWRLAADTLSVELGFEPIDLEGVGPRK